MRAASVGGASFFAFAIAIAACSNGGPAKPAPSGGAGATGSAGTSQTAGVAGAAGVTGAAGSSAPAMDAAVGASGSGGTLAGPDAAAVAEGGAGAAGNSTGKTLPKNVLIFTRSTNAYQHESKPIAAAAIKAALAPLGITAEISEDIALFTTAGLAPFGAIALVDTTGKPVGDPGTTALDALQAFVRAGGGLVSIHAATATTYDVALPYVPLLGGRFVAHPGDVRASTCFPSGSHPAVTQLPPSFPITDEIFTFDNRRTDSEVMVECLATDGKTRLPIAWHHLEGAGRVFNTALGHPVELWAPDGLLLVKHVMPGLLWTLGL